MDRDLIATRDFSYKTRRLKAGDSFSVPEPVARVLVAIKRAEEKREAGHIAPPPPRVAARAATATAKPTSSKTTRKRRAPAKKA